MYSCCLSHVSKQHTSVSCVVRSVAVHLDALLQSLGGRLMFFCFAVCLNLKRKVSTVKARPGFAEMSIWSISGRGITSAFHITLGTYTHQCEHSCSTSKFSKMHHLLHKVIRSGHKLIPGWHVPKNQEMFHFGSKQKTLCPLRVTQSHITACTLLFFALTSALSPVCCMGGPGCGAGDAAPKSSVGVRLPSW